MPAPTAADPTLELTQQLMRQASVTPDDANCQTMMADRLSKLGFHIEPMRFGDVDNLWARRGTSGPVLVFAGHTDVVPTGHWSAGIPIRLRPPFVMATCLAVARPI